MPDDAGGLSSAERVEVGQWLKERWKGDARCFVCQENNWIVGEQLVASPKTNEQGGISIGGSVYPQVMVICNNCGNTLFFNAVLMKIVKGTTENEQKEEDAEGEN